MEKQFIFSKKYKYILIGILVLLGLYLSSLYNYLLFHSLAEIFSIVIGFGIFMVAWNSRRFLDNNYLLFIGIAYLFVASLDLVHTLAYTGMNIFKGYTTNLATQLWIATRYMESISLLIAPLFFRRRLNTNGLFLGYTVVTILLLLSIFYWDIFPTCFIEGVGLTPYKKISEYIISLILLASIALLLKSRDEFDRNVFQRIVWSISLTIFSEMAFTFYIHAYGFSNLVGHYFKIVSFYFIYKALIETGLSRPYDLLFRNLKKSEEALHLSLEESKQRQAEISSLLEALEHSEERHRSVVQTANDAIISADGQGNIVFWNKSAESIFGYSSDEMIRKPLTLIISERFREAHQKAMDRVVSTSKSNIIGKTVEMCGLRKDGSEFPVEISLASWQTREEIFFTGIIRDITDRKKTEEAL